MPREVEPSLNERQFFAKALQENIRLDGRSFDQYRALELDFGDELGVVDVRLGKTRYAISLPSIIHSYIQCGLCSILNFLQLERIILPTMTPHSLTPPQNTHPHLRTSRNTLPRPPHRRPLHHHHRTIPHAVPLNRILLAAHRNRNAPLSTPRKDHPSLRRPRHRITLSNRQLESLVYTRRCTRLKP